MFLLRFLFMASFFHFYSSTKRWFCSRYLRSSGTEGLECFTILSNP
jgi:hypothetical protein